MVIKFDKDPLAVEQNICLSKIENVYIVYDLVGWPRSSTNNVKHKNCLFGAFNLVKSSDKEKYVHNGYGLTFDSASSWSFVNGTTKKVIIFDVDNSLLSQVYNCKNNFLILCLRATFGINGGLGSP